MHLSFFTAVQQSVVGTWVRESVWGFPLSLIVHAWAMALLVGISLLVALSVLGLAPRLLDALLVHARRVIWLAFAFSLGSGVFLISAYPEQPLTSGVFFSKMSLIALALILLLSILRHPAGLPPRYAGPLPLAVRWRAAGVLLCWLATISTGKLLYYTY